MAKAKITMAWTRMSTAESPIGRCRMQHSKEVSPKYKVRRYSNIQAMWQALYLWVSPEDSTKQFWDLLGHFKTDNAARNACLAHYKALQQVRAERESASTPKPKRTRTVKRK